MKTATTLPVPALSYKPRVKKYLIMGVIFITSDKFSIFTAIMSAVMAWVGVFADNLSAVAYGAVVFVLGFVPWGVRHGLRDARQEKIGVGTIKS